MNEHWQHKKRRSSTMSNDAIDHWYQVGMDNGALGGKLVGAGSGGFCCSTPKIWIDCGGDECRRPERGATSIRPRRRRRPRAGLICNASFSRAGRSENAAPHSTSAQCLLAVAGRPFVDWQLTWSAAQGVERAIMSIGYRGDLVRQHLGSGSRFGLEVCYVDEGDVPLGTGGALRLTIDQGVVGPELLGTLR